MITTPFVSGKPGQAPKFDNKTVTRTPSPEQANRIRPHLDSSRRLHELVTELESLGLKQLDTTPHCHLIERPVCARS